MVSEKEIVEQLITRVTEDVSRVIKENLSEIVQKEISKALANALFEGEFHRGVNSEVFTGIENIFAEITSFNKNLSATSHTSVSLLDGSASMLDEIINSTERATLNILDHLDRMQLLVQDARCKVNGGNGLSEEIQLDNMESILTDIMTELSFQDLTGQQIRMIIKSLKRVEELVYEVYLTAEALRKTKEKSPHKDIEELKAEARGLVEGFRHKGNMDQSEIDLMFEECGL
jgi:chemotaxis protein CheZ